MGLKVIGLGFPRTGTRSLKFALETIGFGPCEHLQDMLGRRDPIEAMSWQAKAAGEPIHINLLLRKFQSVCDYPSLAFWPELVVENPDAKFILTKRPTDKWVESALETIAPGLREMQKLNLRTLSRDLICRQTFRDDLSENGLRRAYERHNAAVIKIIEPDKLLQFDVSDGWEPLCSFLKVPVPDKSFPHQNVRADFHKWGRAA